MPHGTRHLFILLTAAALLLRSATAGAQDAIGEQVGPNVAEGRSATDALSRVRVQSGFLRLPRGVELWSTRYSVVWAPTTDLSLRFQIPTPYVLSGANTTSSEFGLGDVSARALWRPWHNDRTAVLAGLEWVFPSATDDSLGTGKYQLSPMAAIVHDFGPFYFVGVYQQLFSYAGDTNRVPIHVIRLRPDILIPLPNRWWMLIEPGFWWDLEDSVLTDDTMTFGLEVGRGVTERLALAAKPSVRVFGSEEFAWSLDFSVSYRFR